MTAADIAGLFGELELLLVESLRRNLARHRKQEQSEGGRGGVPEHWEAWQAAKLREIARFRRENRALLGQYAPRIDAGTRALIEQQAAEGGADGFFVMNDRRVKALIGEMQTAEARAEKAALRYMDDVYRRTVRTAAAGMAAGSMTLPQAVDRATRDFLAAGIRCIRYRDGRQVNIASYAEMALRTAATRAFLIGQAAQRERLGIDTVLVSQYGGCSDTCLPWQGLVYIDDVWQSYHGESNLAIGGSYGQSRNGRSYPLLSVAVRAGLFHPNCRHTLTTWVEGVSRRPRPMDKAKIEAAARLEQKQRALERKVRAAKRQVAGLLDEKAAAEAKKRVRAAQKELREFVAKHGDVLRRDPWRERDTGIAKPVQYGIMGRGNGKSGEYPTPGIPIKIGHIDYHDDDQVEAQFQDFIEKYSDAPYESTRIIAANGDVYEVKGGSARITFGDEMDGILDQAKSIHNHPSGTSAYSFSADIPGDDIPSFLGEHGAVLEAFDEKYRYRFERPGNITPDQWAKEYEKSSMQARILLDEEGYSIDDDATDLFQHYRIRETCKALGIEEVYKRWKR